MDDTTTGDQTTTEVPTDTAPEPAPFDPTTVAVPTTDPTAPVAAPAPAPTGDTSAADRADYEAFVEFQRERREQRERDEAMSKIGMTSQHHVFASSQTAPDGVDTYTTRRGMLLYVEDGKTYSVAPNGSTHSVDGDVFDATVSVARLLDL